MNNLDPILDADAVIQAESPALWAALSPLGRRARQPAAFLPLQTAEARGRAFNATIGQITDGHGQAVPLPSMAAALAGLSEAERSRAFLYSPVEGLPELRQRWREWQRRDQGEERPSTLPLVTMGTAHARHLAAEMFVTEGRTVVTDEPCRPEDRALFEVRLGARLRPVPLYDGRFDPTAALRALGDLPDGEPVVLLLRFPDDRGYTPKYREKMAFCRALAEGAAERPIVVLVDDTWEVPDAASGSLFWLLHGCHPNIVPIKLDGADGHLGFPGGRVGFLTFPFAPESGIAKALESKIKMLLRAEVGSPTAAGQ
ncbi:MAG TPA: aminotransferase class I/II-fold pyridoxal phosphate-dependent enzyme, partial [Thermoanaerobaculia bacterium]|nr:aminotransferase class I/II-fold pyridoxal phosphate-dependent enzyme [Thermoanaerobaculia bacterium]